MRVLMLLAGVALAAACGRTGSGPGPTPSGGWKSFEGTWTAAGDRRTIESRPGRQVSVVDLSGSILLVADRGLGVGFQAHAIAYTDGEKFNVGRAVWTDERGDVIYSELSGAEFAAGRHITGKFTGGTGRWTGIVGEYGFDWKYLIDAEERVQGRAEELRGRAQVVRPEGRIP